MILALNRDRCGVDKAVMSIWSAATDEPAPARPIGAGTILVNQAGRIRILRSRRVDDAGWNCSDGAALDDADLASWDAYAPEQLVADLMLAREVRGLGGFRELSGGLATWDACSGRPCVLPKLAKLVP